MVFEGDQVSTPGCDVIIKNVVIIVFLHRPIDMALETAAITIDEISEVILVGAGTRYTAVQSKRSVNSISVLRE